ncbi:hypothetical protein ALI22I_04875 [Saccharothrix sp. ALI-22-I]|uniref:hypothetical protein n=1 Tax=Saccharothrix sp. ALI-22-I TaxID=1933778 RepID=UPI00097C3B38|nr:hypothetical protein [Saccharothrix sp. ALI-22-I]ONI92278.1 hypothetical protein ALI22I_04875 [Saccharothrix sp. ALI-22-I]
MNELASRAVRIVGDPGDWRAVQLAGWSPTRESAGYTVFDVVPAVRSDPPPRPRGVAFTPQGNAYDLTDPDRLRTYAAGLPPVEAARLICRYQGDFTRHQNLVESLDALADHLGDHMPQHVAPVSEHGFFSYHLEKDAAGVYRVSVNEWRTDTADGLPWSAVTIASSVPSRHYPGRPGLH